MAKAVGYGAHNLMSYDMNLRDPVTRETLQVPAHMMHGGNVPCEVINGQLVPTSTTEAYLNITYNYGHYYYEAFPGREDDAEQFLMDQARFHLKSESGGIRSLEELSGIDAVPVLEEMIRRIEARYKNPDGSWQINDREELYYIDHDTGRESHTGDVLSYYFQLRRNGLSEADAEAKANERYEKRKRILRVNEGGDGGSYWTDTAANAIRPLYQLITLSRMRPDGVWTEDS